MCVCVDLVVETCIGQMLLILLLFVNFLIPFFHTSATFSSLVTTQVSNIAFLETIRMLFIEDTDGGIVSAEDDSTR